METIDLLKKLCEIPTPSGFENFSFESVKNLFGDKLPSSNRKYYTDKINNQYFEVLGSGVVDGKSVNKTKIMISGHIDELGFRVQNIDKNGFIHIQRIGGIDTKVCQGQRVLVLDDNGNWLKGVIGKKPIHLESGEERKGGEVKIENLIVDLGVISNDKNSKKPNISIGNPIVYDRDFTTLNNGLVSSPGLDDKSGCLICLQILDHFIKNPNPYVDLVCVLTTQEEEGLRGANISASRIQPDISIDFDVTFSTDEGRGINENLIGKVELGKGGVLVHGSDKSEHLIKEFKSLKNENGEQFKFQEICSRSGGTNTSTIQLNSFDCETMLISIPNRNMHTPVEIVSLDDLDEIINMTNLWLDNFKG